MSRSANPAASNSSKFKLTIKLEGAINLEKWRSSLQNKLFRFIKNTNMDKLTIASTLNRKYLKATFPDDWKDASKDDDDNPADPLDNEEFVQACLDHALESGEGFNDWLYDVFEGIRDSLSEDIAEQTSGVAIGDLLALFTGINLAIGHVEHHDPQDLDIVYGQCTMAGEGNNDIMKFTATLTSYMRRLTAAGHGVTDAKAQRVLLRGLDQEIFEAFISTADRTPYDNYKDLEHALKKAAGKPLMLKKLQELKPGTTQSALTMRARST